MNFTPDIFIDSIYQHATVRQKEFTDKKTKQSYIEKGLAASLGPFPHVTDEVKNVQPVLLEKKEFAGYTRERIVFHTTKELTVPIYVLTPKNEKKQHAAVLALHGHGYGSREIVGLTSEGKEYYGNPGIHQHFALQLVKKGLKVIAPEVIGFGDRMLLRDKEENKPSSCEALAVNLLMAGQTLPGLRVFEAIRVIDLIHSFDDVTPNQIGIMGFSGGGMIAAYTSALDKRIQATVLTGFANTYRGSILNMHHCIDNYLPGILRYGELPDILELIAPRHLFIEAGENDPIFPVQHVRTAISQLEKTYAILRSESRFSYDIFEGSHEVSGRKSFDWLEETLSNVDSGGKRNN